MEQKASGPLTGIRVIDCASMIAAPYAATLFADMGADVIKLEPPSGDGMRRIGQIREGESGSFVGVNRGKRGIALDLRQPEGREVLSRLLAGTDVLLTNTREPALSKLGLAYDQVCKHRPDVIWASVSTFGPDGPYAGRPGVDVLAQALCGVPMFNGAVDQPPVRLNMPIADVMTSLLAANGVLAALYERERTGQGQRLDVALIDALVHALCNALGNYFVADWVPPRTGNRSPYFAPSGMYATADGASIFITTPTEKFFLNLCRALSVDWPADPRFKTSGLRLQHEDELDALLATECGRYSRNELMERLVAADATASPVNRLPDVVRDPQVIHNRMVVTTEHSALGDVRATGVPIHFGGSPGMVQRAAPVLGEHTREVLRELGYAISEVAVLEGAGVAVSWGGAG